ncbi:MAG: acyl carrier protein [Fuerstiella sp.]|nr:acyl carrier protein [Fuerstiella sp.]MCP4854520.1 acyl carrier protein [Fuerstiella sp.]
MSLEQVFANVFCIPDADVKDELLLKEIATWDSMSHMMLIMQMEESFKVQLTSDQIADIKSVGDARFALQIQGAKL